MTAPRAAQATQSRPSPILAHYAHPGPMSAAPGHAAALDALPGDLPALVAIVQGLLIHDHLAEAYGVKLTAKRREERHLRKVSDMLDLVVARDATPLDEARAPKQRLVGVCRHFALLLAAFLQARHVPARARCGFATYFNPDGFEDHWICETWDEADGRWKLVDAQLDATQRDRLKIEFDPLDVPRDKFMVAAEAWRRFRAGEAAPEAFGIFGKRGAWLIAGNLVRDLAALDHREMLPWDVWGPMPRPGETIGGARLALFDRIAALTAEPDAHFDAHREFYEDHDVLHVPPTVFNALREREEAV